MLHHIHSAFIRYFNEVRRCGSIRQAARRLYVASSAVNRQILKAEDALGVALFERTPQGLRLTPAGQRLAEHVERTLADAERTLADIRSLRSRAAGQVILAGPESVIEHFLPPVLARFHADAPDSATAFKAASDITQRLPELLGSGEVDIAVTFDPQPHPAVQVLYEQQLPVGAVMTPDHPLASRDSLSLADCAGYPLVLPDPTWPLRATLDSLIDAAGLNTAVITSSNSVELLRLMIANRLGLGFQTVVGIETGVTRGELALVPIVDGGPLQQTLAVCVGTERNLSPAVQRMLEGLDERLRSYAG
jgi:DNA-binding transcriptional LysR family regulator